MSSLRRVSAGALCVCRRAGFPGRGIPYRAFGARKRVRGLCRAIQYVLELYLFCRR